MTHISIPNTTTWPFALITQWWNTTFTTGDLKKHDLLEQMGQDSLSILPYSQIKEKWYAYVWEDMPILSIEVTSEQTYITQELLDHLPEHELEKQEIISDMSDENYAQIVEQIIQEIKQGEWCNFVISRQFQTQITNIWHETMLTIYKDLVIAEPNAYMVFLFFTGEQYFIGASPEVHLKVENWKATMNPISWTLPKSKIQELDKFLQDKKEIYELHKVLDEEMKMMARICSSGGQITGPLLKEMAQLIHTEYELTGRLTIDPIDALRISMYAPTLTGWPIENACRVISTVEKTSRRYYGTALVRRKGNEMDSSITIRTAEVDLTGLATVRAGASLVIDSDPMSEAVETRTKAKWILNIIWWEGRDMSGGSTKTPYAELLWSSHIQWLLEARNTHLSQFLLNKQSPQQFARDSKALIIDNGDDFIYVLEHMLHSLNITTQIKKWTDLNDLSPGDVSSIYDLVIVWPWPWDPNNMPDLQDRIRATMDTKVPLLWICLWHQLISLVCWYTIEKKETSTQWVHMMIDIFGTPYLMGYYNSFWVKDTPENRAVSSQKKHAVIPGQDGCLDVIKGEWLYSVQFHPESVLSQYGYGCIQRMLEGVGVL